MMTRKRGDNRVGSSVLDGYRQTGVLDVDRLVARRHALRQFQWLQYCPKCDEQDIHWIKVIAASKTWLIRQCRNCGHEWSQDA